MLFATQLCKSGQALFQCSIASGHVLSRGVANTGRSEGCRRTQLLMASIWLGDRCGSRCWRVVISRVLYRKLHYSKMSRLIDTIVAEIVVPDLDCTCEC